MFAVFFRFLNDKKKTFLVYLVSAIGLMEMYIAMFPSINIVAQDKLDLLMQSFPKEIWTLVGVDPEKLMFTKIESFISMEFYSFIWPILLITFAVSLANSAIVNEIERGNIENILSQPISRTKLFITRFLAGFSILTAFIWSSVYAIVPLVRLHNIKFSISNNVTIALSGMLFVLVVYSVAMLASSIFSEKGKASFLVTGVILVSYVLNVIAGLKENMQNLKYYSLFHYYNATTNFVDSKLIDNAVWFSLGVSVVFILVAIIYFNKRDVAV